MKSNSSTPFLPTERKKTDASLVAERDKTNESLVELRENTEKQVDNKVVNERAAADQTTLQSREAADIGRDSERNAKNYDIRDERQNSDDRLLEERRRADLAIDLERKRVDLAIDNERELKNTLADQLLNRERRITDQNLKDERFQTDSQVNQSSGKLESEVSEHLKTKTTLTSRDQLLAIVSHDLRNPIGAISSCAGMLLEEDSFQAMNPELKHWIHFMKRNADTSLRLIADLLDLERFAQGKMVMKPTRQVVNDLARETVETFAMSASAKSISLTVHLTPTNSEAICDGDRIRQVISNLIGNAIKFTPVKGTIRVSVHTDKEEVKISVQDSGPGVPKEKNAQIFERFAQIGSKDRSGLGLGLYISKTLVEAHKGKIWLESAPETGSNFTFSIPRSAG